VTRFNVTVVKNVQNGEKEDYFPTAGFTRQKKFMVPKRRFWKITKDEMRIFDRRFNGRP